MSKRKHLKPRKDNNKVTGIHTDEIRTGYPLFSFKYFDKSCLKDCPQKQLQSFIDRLQRLSELGWKEINQGGRHNYGYECLDQSVFKCEFPEIVTPDVSIMVFRYDNANHPFIAFRQYDILYLLGLEVNFGDLYNHYG